MRASKFRKHRPYRVIIKISLDKGTLSKMYKDIRVLLQEAGIEKSPGKTGTFESERADLHMVGVKLSEVMTALADFDTGYVDHMWIYIDKVKKANPK